MPKPKKTLRVENIKEQANTLFRESLNDYAVQRQAVQHFVSHLLMEHGAYKGFGYLYEHEVPPSNSFGIVFDESPARAHQYPDPTRIKLF